jgi:ribosomal protein S8
VKDLLASREVENIFENLYCKGYISNVLLLQNGSQPIRSSLRLGQPKGGDSEAATHYRKPLPKLQHRARMRRGVAVYAPEIPAEGLTLPHHYKAA